MRVGLALGGGGARGLAHIGVLQALEEHGITPVAISGCSMGAIVGAFYAAGFSPQEQSRLVKSLRYQQLLTLGEMGGIVGGKKIEAFFKKHLPSTFEALNLPLEVTTVDVQAGCLVVLRKGKLVPALRATSALPGILSPVNYRGRFLVDGGLLNNLPVDVIRTMTLEPVIAVDVSAPPNRALEFNKPSLAERVDAVISGKRKPFSDLFKRGLTIELFMKAFDVPQKVITDMRLSLQPPDLLIRPNLDTQFGVEAFERFEEAIRLGYEAACASLDSYLESPEVRAK